jgi:hypothetical protein
MPKIGASGPFRKLNLVSVSHVFKDGGAFFAFLERKRRSRLKPRFAEAVRSFEKWPKEAISTGSGESKRKPR